MIAAMIAVFAVVLITQLHHLIAGRPVPDRVHASIRAGVASVSEVEAINSMAATFAGSDEIVVDLDLDLREELTTGQIEEALDAIHDAVTIGEPRVKRLRVDLNSPSPAAPRSRR